MEYKLKEPLPWVIVHEGDKYEIHNEFGYWTQKNTLEEAKKWVEEHKYSVCD